MKCRGEAAGDEGGSWLVGAPGLGGAYKVPRGVSWINDWLLYLLRSCYFLLCFRELINVEISKIIFL